MRSPSEREKRAKIIHAEGELQASERLAQAARVIAAEPITIQLRYLQTLTEIGTEKNSTITFSVPIDVLRALVGVRKGSTDRAHLGQTFLGVDCGGTILGGHPDRRPECCPGRS